MTTNLKIMKNILTILTCPFLYKTFIKLIVKFYINNNDYQKQRFFFFSELFLIAMTLIANIEMIYQDILNTIRNYNSIFKIIIYIFTTRFIVKIILYQILPDCQHYNENVKNCCKEEIFCVALFTPFFASFFFKKYVYNYLRIVACKSVKSDENDEIFTNMNDESKEKTNSSNDILTNEISTKSDEHQINYHFDRSNSILKLKNKEKNIFNELNKPKKFNKKIINIHLINGKDFLDIDNNNDKSEILTSVAINEPPSIIDLFCQGNYLAIIKIIMAMFFSIFLYLLSIKTYSFYIHCEYCNSLDVIIFMFFFELTESYSLSSVIEFIQNILFFFNILDKHCCK
ncbi:hypothetical protein DMUE_3242 [Dictyocoela muelleri]|nr:hypothetical protein DMUE_3242 [Dictyocoela muelleri]